MNFAVRLEAFDGETRGKLRMVSFIEMLHSAGTREGGNPWAKGI